VHKAKAISLTRPWGFIIRELGKRIENRSWETEYRGPIFLHSSKKMTLTDWYAAHDFVAHFDPEGASRIPKPKSVELDRESQMIFATATLVDIILPKFQVPRRLQQRRGFAAWLERQRVWYMGAFGFVLEDLEPTVFTPCSGLLGLWDVPPDVAARALNGRKL
jgi:hypothetical protein